MPDCSSTLSFPTPGCELKPSAELSPMGILTTLQELEAIYGSPVETSIVKEVDAISPHYRRLIEASSRRSAWDRRG
jgi:hypothetical protein